MPSIRSAHLDPEAIRRGASLRAIREATGFRVVELAGRMQVSPAHLTNIEAGRRTLSPALARLAAEALECRPVALLRPDEFSLKLEEVS